MKTRLRSALTLFLVLAASIVGVPATSSALVPAPPPLATSSNVQLLGNVPVGAAIGMNFKDHYAFVTGPQGLTVLDIAVPAAPAIVSFVPLPHFENEDVDLCGDTLLISNDRGESDLGAVLYAFDISNPALPLLVSTTPVGLRLAERGAGHIANFVTSDCSQVWLDGGTQVEVMDLTDPSAPVSLGTFESVASHSDAFNITHDTERDSSGTLWNVGGGGVAGYQLTADPLAPKLIGSSSAAGMNPSPYNDFILHNSQRRGQTLLITEEDYIDTSETPPGGCRGQGHFETWKISNKPGGITPLDTWTTEANAADSKAPLTVNCSSHWFDEYGGIAAVGWYEQGVRFIDVHKPTNLRQVGFYLPANGSTWAAYWSPTDPTHSIVYTADAYRGVDVLRIARKGDPGVMPALTAPIPAAWTTSSLDATPSDVWGWACQIPATAVTVA
jgi:hypothetical protein